MTQYKRTNDLCIRCRSATRATANHCRPCADEVSRKNTERYAGRYSKGLSRTGIPAEKQYDPSDVATDEEAFAGSPR